MSVLRKAADILDENRIALQSMAFGRQYTTCPECSASRRLSNQKLKCLAVNVEAEGVKFFCNHCGFAGGRLFQFDRTSSAKPIDPAEFERTRALAAERQRLALAQSQIKVKWLWAQRQPIEATVECYLRKVRGYRGLLPPTIGFLPGSNLYPPAMITAFGMARETEPGQLAIDDSAVTGIHLTKLKPDGSAKAGIEGEPDKVTIGQGNTCPVWLAAINDSMGLVITEGIEDALSAHQASGKGAWAAGAAARLPAMAQWVPSYVESVTLLVDADDSGEKYSTQLAEALVARGFEVLMCRLPESTP